MTVIAVVCGLQSVAESAGIYRDGQSARAMALGGSETATANSPLDALSGNPGALGEIRGPTLDLGVTAGLARGRFTNAANDNAKMSESGYLPHAAVGVPFGRATIGLGLLPTAAIRGDWQLRDAPGGLGGQTSYGSRTYRSEIVLLRAALGVSWEICDELSAGASVGLLYNANRLQAPYTFQTQPVLRSAKVLLDLETEGYGWNAQFGVLWKPIAALQIGLSYTTESRIQSSGSAKANASAQFDSIGLVAQERADFDAEVTNVFPQIVSTGLAWKITPRVTIATQLDWINWADSFETLEVRLRNGDNQDLNGLVGDDRIDEDIALDWRDQFVWRAGLEWNIDEHWTLRGGYSYGRNPVPDATLTPLTGAIMEHTVSAGAGYRRGRASIDLSWQWNLPNEERVRVSDLAPEYHGSTVETGVHWFGLTTSFAL